MRYAHILCLESTETTKRNEQIEASNRTQSDRNISLVKVGSFKRPTSVPLEEVNTIDTKKGKANHFDRLPDEVVLRVYQFIDVPAIGRLAQVCRRFHRLSGK